MAALALSVVVPAYNEEHRLPRLLQALDRELDTVLRPTEMQLGEVIVVDDGSSDRTAEIVQDFDGLAGRLNLIRLPENRGKGAAVRAGMLAARGDRALMTDADMSTPLSDVVGLSAALDAGADIGLGSRALDRSQVLVHQPAVREFMGKGFNVLLRLATDIPWRDTQCGFKLFRLSTTRPLFEAQRIEGFAFDAELCINARRLKLSVVEVPVHWSNESDTRVRIASSSSRMALDVVRIAIAARRPLSTGPAQSASHPGGLPIADASPVTVGLPPGSETLGA